MCWCRYWEMRLISMRSRVGDAEWCWNKYSTANALPMDLSFSALHCVFVLYNALLLPTMSCPERPRWSVNSERLVLASMADVCVMCPGECVWCRCDAQRESCEVQGEAGSARQTPDKGFWEGLPVHQPPATQHLPRTRECKDTRALFSAPACPYSSLTHTFLKKKHPILVSLSSWFDLKSA